MFDFVGKHKRLLQILLALILVPPFAFFGIQSFTPARGRQRHRGSGRQRDLARRVRRAPSSSSATSCAPRSARNFDPALLDTPEARKQLLDNLVARRVIGLYLARNRLSASDEQVRELIAAEPAFQEDGKFSRGRYEALMRAART